MTESHSIEEKGKEVLLKRLRESGRKAETSDDRTFDLVVDGNYVEVKVKKHGWDKFDFIRLTAKQKQALGKKLKTIFLVLNVDKPDEVEVIEIDANELLKCKNQGIMGYEWNKGSVKHLRQIS